MIVPFAALYVVNRIKEKFHKTRGESKYMDYATASYSVGQLVDPAVIGRRSVTVTIVCDILDKFEEMHPEGKTDDGGYDGSLLESWVSYNIAYLLVNKRGDMQRVPQ